MSAAALASRARALGGTREPNKQTNSHNIRKVEVATRPDLQELEEGLGAEQREVRRVVGRGERGKQRRAERRAAGHVVGQPQQLEERVVRRGVRAARSQREHDRARVRLRELDAEQPKLAAASFGGYFRVVEGGVPYTTRPHLAVAFESFREALL